MALKWVEWPTNGFTGQTTEQIDDHLSLSDGMQPTFTEITMQNQNFKEVNQLFKLSFSQISAN